MGTPLRPPPEDVELCRNAVASWQRESGVDEPRALVLGVTPELVAMHWPPRTRVLALDLSPAMIHGVWPGPLPGHGAVCADWLRLPLADREVQIIVGDGSYNALPSGDLYPALTRSLRAAIDERGLLLLRFFVRPDAPESPDAVCDALHAGRIGNLHVFKWRLAMALHRDLGSGVRLADIWRAWHEAVPEPIGLMATLGWPADLLETIDGYRDVETCYTFPTLDEVRAALAPAFRECLLHTPDYELGERCPTLVLRPR